MKPLIRSACMGLLLSGGIQAMDGCASPTVGKPVRWTPRELSTDQYESSAVFASGGQEMYFMRADRNFGNYRILQSHCVDGRWTEPKKVAFSSVAGADDGDPFVTREGSQLYFISTRHRFSEVGNEDFDIFVSTRSKDGEWEAPVRLPEPVNSVGSELLPRFDSAGTLYFGSDRPGGVGGADIYSAQRIDDGTWQVQNLKSLNTSANEYEAAISDDGTEIAVISDREGKSRVHLFKKERDQWVQTGRIRAREAVFQVGPLWSSDGRRLMFSQDAGQDSGEIFVIDTKANPDAEWPPTCVAEKQ